ncbi:hypothetical protein KAW08_03465 [bacterium]|nr:hypothetical protein [bacterium]
MEDKKANPITEDKNIQKEPELTQSSGINIQPPKQESAPAPTQVQPSNVIKPPETTQDINIKRNEKEEKPDFLKHPPKKLGKKEKSKFIGTVLILSLIISTCSIVLLLFCIKNTAIPQFIQQTIDYLYKISQNYL